MLFVGLDDKSSANRTSRFVKRASPNTAPPNSSSAQLIALHKFNTLPHQMELWGMGWLQNVPLKI
jgi:hypothetical protein